MGIGCYIWYSKEGIGRDPSPPRPLLAVPNVTAHPSTASVPTTVLLYNGPLLCGFNVPVKGLNWLNTGNSESVRLNWNSKIVRPAYTELLVAPIFILYEKKTFKWTIYPVETFRIF